VAPRFPLFINLEGRSCLLVGGGEVAARKAQSLAGFGALIAVVDPAPGGKIRALAEEGLLRLRERPYGGPGELEGVYLVVAAADDGELNKRVAFDAGSRGIPVNVSDAPELCGFFFPALVRRGALVAAISTSGACPRLAARLRQKLEGLLPPGLGEALEGLREERRRLRESFDPAETLRRLDELIDALVGEDDPGP
jgi:siroheme synthase-like protein